MIVRPRPHWLRLLFVWRGSLVHDILPQQVVVFLWAVFVVVAHGQLFHWKVTLTAVPFSLMGVTLAIFMGFRLNASYDRYWEARKLWGSVLVASRDVARKALTGYHLPAGGGGCGCAPRSVGDAMTPEPVEAQVQAAVFPFIHEVMALAAAMRNQLRGRERTEGLSQWLTPAVYVDLQRLSHVPNALLLRLSRTVQHWREQGALHSLQAQDLSQSLDMLSLAWGGCERIANTPLPFAYSVILHRSAYLYCVLLPFGLLDSIGFMTPLVVCFISYTFLALEALSAQIEEPFGMQPNDLALDAIVHGIVSNLGEMMGEPALPPLQPGANFVLH